MGDPWRAGRCELGGDARTPEMFKTSFFTAHARNYAAGYWWVPPRPLRDYHSDLPTVRGAFRKIYPVIQIGETRRQLGGWWRDAHNWRQTTVIPSKTSPAPTVRRDMSYRKAVGSGPPKEGLNLVIIAVSGQGSPPSETAMTLTLAHPIVLATPKPPFPGNTSAPSRQRLPGG